MSNPSEKKYHYPINRTQRGKIIPTTQVVRRLLINASYPGLSPMNRPILEIYIIPRRSSTHILLDLDLQNMCCIHPNQVFLERFCINCKINQKIISAVERKSNLVAYFIELRHFLAEEESTGCSVSSPRRLLRCEYVCILLRLY